MWHKIIMKMTGQKLRKIRMEYGYTLRDVQDESRKRGYKGVSMGHLQMMETGKREISDNILFLYKMWGWIKSKGW